MGLQSAFEDSVVWMASRSSFHHLGARTEKSRGDCLPCILKDGGSIKPYLKLKGLEVKIKIQIVTEFGTNFNAKIFTD